MDKFFTLTRVLIIQEGIFRLDVGHGAKYKYPSLHGCPKQLVKWKEWCESQKTRCQGMASEKIHCNSVHVRGDLSRSKSLPMNYRMRQSVLKLLQ